LQEGQLGEMSMQQGSQIKSPQIERHLDAQPKEGSWRGAQQMQEEISKQGQIFFT